MAGTELGIADRQVAVRASALVEDLHVAWTAHRLQGEAAFAVGEGEHVVAEFFPVAALLPERAGKELRCADLAEAGAAHAAADVVFENAVDGKAARVPEYHAWSFLLLVEEVEPIADGTVIFDVHVSS